MPFFEDFWERALPAADFDALLVRPSLSVLAAADAAFLLVCLGGALVWERALPAEAFDVLPVDLDVKVWEALLAACLLVTFVFLLAIAFLTFNLLFEGEPRRFEFDGNTLTQRVCQCLRKSLNSVFREFLALQFSLVSN